MKSRSKLLPRSKNTFKVPERQIQQMIINYLKFKGWYVMRLNSGKYSVGEGRARRFVMGQEAGTPDVMAFKEQECFNIECRYPLDVSLLFVEVKSGTNKPTALQVAKMKELEKYGARCVVAYGIEDLEKEGI